MRLVVDNRQIVFTGSKRLAKMLDERTAYRVEGFMFSDAYKRRFWDGKEHLVKSVKGKDFWKAPVGLLGELLAVAKALDVEIERVEDERRPARLGTVETTWNARDYELRPYQRSIVEEIALDRGLETGKMLIDAPTRSGKTVTMAATIDRLQCPTLILVQSKLVMNQTVKTLRDTLGIRPGRIGAGVWDPGPVTVASCQTLTHHSNVEEAMGLTSSYDAIFMDECQHLAGKVWRRLLESFDAIYKVGWSATIFLHRKKETPKGTIWLRAATGPVRFKITPSELIELGYLVPPRIDLVRVTDEVDVDPKDWPGAYDAGIVHHEERNGKVVDAVLRWRREGMSALVVVRTLDHVDVLEDLLLEAGLSVGVIVGETPTGERKRLIRRYEKRKIDVLLGTVFGEGVDIPRIQLVVNAEGGKSRIAVVQRFRNLTPDEGKELAVLVDFADLHHPILAEHSTERLKEYRRHSMFDVGVQK